MKRSRFSDGLLFLILKQHLAALAGKDLCRKHGVSAASFYKWRPKYGGM